MTMLQTTLINNIAIVIQIIKLHNLLDLPAEIDIEFEEGEVDKDQNWSAASADILDQTIYIAPELAHWNIEDVIDIVAHELVHIEQGHIGWLQISKDCKFEWFGYNFDLPKNHVDYLNFPWERDAYRRGPEVGKQVIKIMKRNKRGQLSGNC